MMAIANVNDRRIRKLRLKVDHSSRVHRGSALIEEALRLATVPGENQGRSYHFRYLNLGAIRPAENIIQVTARLEAEFQRLVSQAVHVEDPQAEISVAVYFRSPLEPWRYVLARIARGLPHDTWFVRAALPELQPSFTPAEVMRHVIAETSRQPDGLSSLAGTAHLFAQLLQAGELLPLLALIEQEIIIQLFRRFADYVADQVAVPAPPNRLATERIAPAPHRSVRVPAAWVIVLEKAIQLWGSNTNDVRTIWLAALSLVAEAPVRSTDSQLPAKADAVVAKVLASPAATISRSRMHPRHSAAIAPTTKPAPPSGRISFEEAQSQLFQQPSPEQSRQHGTHTSEATAPEAPVDEETEYQPSALSRHAGFYFLLHVLRHLGMVEFLAANSELADINFPWLLLRALAKHAGIKDDDPIISFAGTVAEEDLARWFEVKIPENWKSVFPANYIIGDGELSAAALIRWWIIAVHRWLKRYAHLKISELVNRRGAVAYARPQTDITLLLNDVDLRIRQLGLDLDPGWIPWLGLIVHIHYERVLGVNECPAP